MRQKSHRATVLLVLLAGTGCDPVGPERSDSPAMPGAVVEERAETAGRMATIEPAQTEEHENASRRRSELQAQIEAARLQRSSLQQEHQRIAALVQSHQNESEQKLAAFKTQFQALQQREAAEAAPGGERDQFAERARNELEAALSLDQEYLAQLAEVSGKLSETDAHLRQMQEELSRLPASQ